jgi:hypothetical protein
MRLLLKLYEKYRNLFKKLNYFNQFKAHYNILLTKFIKKFDSATFILCINYRNQSKAKPVLQTGINKHIHLCTYIRTHVNAFAKKYNIYYCSNLIFAISFSFPLLHVPKLSSFHFIKLL